MLDCTGTLIGEQHNSYYHKGVPSTTPKKEVEMRHRAHPTKTAPDFKTKHHNTTKSIPNLPVESPNHGSHLKGT
jgi:hypothetical protein